jgi:hypothetical protein
MSEKHPSTGLEFEGEAARQRFIVYWLRPAVAALFFGLFTFFVVSIPGENEKIKLRSERQSLLSANEETRRQLDFAEPLARMASVDSLALRDGGTADGAWARLLFSETSGRGMLLVQRIEASDDERAFCWHNVDGERRPLAAIDLQKGAGRAEIRLGGLSGTLEIGVEKKEGEPTGTSPVQLALSLTQE